jgi:hypothetical protein
MTTIESLYDGALNGPLPPPLSPPQPPYPPRPQAVAATPSNGVGVAGGVLGIVGLVLSFIPVLDVIGLVLAILAVIFGGVGIQKANAAGGVGKGMAVTGLVCGLVAMAIGFLLIAVVFSASSAVMYP